MADESKSAFTDGSTAGAGTGSNDDRMNSIMRVDTQAVLASILSIEKALTDYQKPGDVPKWGQAMVARLELMERQANRTPRKTEGGGSVGTAGGMMQPASLASAAQEEKLLDKLREEMSHTIGSSSVQLESKIGTMTLELDRLQKLLTIRPTTSELQQVVLTIHDMNRKLQDGVLEMQKNVRTNVATAVAEETINITASVQSNIDLSAQSIGLIAKKVDGYNGDISSIRKTTEQAIDTFSLNIKQCQYDVQTSKELVLQMEATAEADAAKYTQNFANMTYADEMLGEKLEELKGGVSEKVDAVTKAMADQSALVGAQLAESGEKIITMSSIAEITKKDIDDFRFTYEVDTKVQLEENTQMRAAMSEMEAKNMEMAEYVLALKDFDVMKQIELQGEQQGILKQATDDNESTLGGINSKVGKVQKVMNKIEEKMEALPTQVEAAMVKMDVLTQNAMTAQEELQAAKAKMATMEEKQKQIDTLNDRTALQQDTIEDLEKRLKQALSTNMSLLEVTGDHETRLEQMTELIDNSDAIVEQKMLKMQTEIMDNVAAKQAEADALLANMQENLEVMSLGMDGSQAAGSAVGGGGRAGIGGGGGAGGAGGLRKSGAAGLRGKPGGAPGSNPNSAPGSAPAGDGAGGAGGAGTYNETTEVITESANFVADLCVNFEEISVRKSYVNALPSAMTENIALTAQSVAATIAHSTDFEAVQMALRAEPGGLEYDDTAVGDMRQRKIEEFLSHVHLVTHSNHDRPGAVRSDARKAFMTTLKKAVDLCMSKHDQVLVVGNSRFGRMKIPTCIACDRPLVDKVRQERSVPADSGPQRDFPGFPQFGQGGSIDDSTLSGGALHGSPVPRNKQRGGNNAAKQSIKLPRTHQEKVARPSSSQAAAEAGAMRGGMKAPRPGHSDFASGANGNQEGLPQMSQSQSGFL